MEVALTQSELLFKPMCSLQSVEEQRGISVKQGKGATEAHSVPGR